MAGINIDILANTRQFQAGTKDVEKALDGVADSLDHLALDAARSADQASDALSDGFRDSGRDVERAIDDAEDSLKDLSRAAEREGRDAGDELADGVKDGAKDAETALEKTERSFKELADTAKREDPGKSLGDSVRKGTDEAGEGLGEFKDEANSTAREAAASFDGSAASIGDAFQEVAANAFAGFGPAGAVAGLAAAAGLGLVFAQVEKNDERTEQLREQVAALADEYISTGRIGGVAMSTVADNIRDMALATEDGETTLADLRKTADDAGVSFEKLAKAKAGDADALDELIDATDRQIEALKNQDVSQQAVAGSGLRARDSHDNQRAALIDLRDTLEEQVTTQDRAADSARNYADTNADAMLRAAEASQDYSEQVQDAYADAGAGIDDYVGGSVEALQEYTEQARIQAEAVAAYQQNMVTLSSQLSADALAYVQSLGPAAAPLIQDFVNAPLDQRQATADVWNKLGATSSTAFGSKLQSDLDASYFSTDVDLKTNPGAIQTALNSRNYSVSVEARVRNNIQNQLPARQGMGVP